VYNLNYTPTTLGVKFEEKLHLGVREQKELNTTGLVNRLTDGSEVVSLVLRPSFNLPGLFLVLISVRS
jgi:hypothetical protein